MTQLQFNIFWDGGTNNEADYTTKHHATIDHRAKRARYIQDRVVNYLENAQQDSSQTLLREGVLLRTWEVKDGPQSDHITRGHNVWQAHAECAEHGRVIGD